MATSKLMSVYKPSFDVLQTELVLVNEDIKLMHRYKEETISEFENKKLSLRQLTDSNKIYAYFKKTGKKFQKPKNGFFSSVAREDILSVLDREISLIQNQYDLIYNELKELKADLEQRVRIVEKTELVMNILNYRIYETHYSCRKKLDKLKEAKDNIKKKSPEDTDAEMAVRRVEIDRELLECEQLYQDQLRSIKEQKLEAQQQYEDAVNIMDDNLQLMRKHYNILLLIIEAEKAQLNDSQTDLIDMKYAPITAQLQMEIDNFTELQTVGWKTKQMQRMSAILQERGLKFTTSGLLVTESGKQITYEEARNMKLLDDINLSLELFKTDKEEEAEVGSKQSKDVETDLDSDSD